MIKQQSKIHLTICGKYFLKSIPASVSNWSPLNAFTLEISSNVNTHKSALVIGGTDSGKSGGIIQ